MNGHFSADTLKLAGLCAPLADATAQRQMLRELREKPWVVYAKRPFAGTEQVLDYLGRYLCLNRRYPVNLGLTNNVANLALNLAPFGRWTLRDEAAQRRLAQRWASQAMG